MNLREYALATFGGSSWDAVLDDVEPFDRRVLQSLVTVGWYPLDLEARVIRAIDRTLGSGDLGLANAMGRFSAEHDLTTIHRIFLRMITPAFAMEKLLELWPRYQDTGSWRLENAGTKHVIGHLSDWGHVDQALCLVLAGYIERTLELVGSKYARVDHVRCRSNGEPACAFEARWGAIQELRSDLRPTAPSGGERREAPPAPRSARERRER